MTTTATRRRKPYAGSRFSDPDWTSPPATPPAGFPPLADDEPAEPGFHQDPADEPVPPDSSLQLDEPAATRPRGSSMLSAPDTGDASGFVLGLFATVLMLQYLHGGPAQVRKWLAAKFLNRDGTVLIPDGVVGGHVGVAPSNADGGGGGVPILRGGVDSKGYPY